jgi:hypothetical protein
MEPVSAQIEQLDQGLHEHAVEFYDDLDELATRVGTYLAAALEAGGVALVVAEESHRNAFAAWLGGAGVDIRSADSEHRLVLRDAAGSLAQFMVDGRPDPDRFDAVIGGAVRAAVATGRPVSVYGEMVAVLWRDGNVNAAIELEGLWNDLARHVPFSLLCSYPCEDVDGRGGAAGLAQVCHLHSAVGRKFAAAPQSPRAARRFSVHALAGWRRGDLADVVQLVVSELTTNAIVHAGSSFTLTLTRTAHGVRVAVRDASVHVPVQRAAAATDWSGRGLRLLTDVAREWGTAVLADGKEVWADVGS